MKKLQFKFAALTVISLALIISCNKNSDYFSNNDILKIEDFEIIGIEHNEALDYVFHKLKSFANEEDAVLKSKENIITIAESSIKDFMNKYNLASETMMIAYENIEEVFSTRDYILNNKSSHTNNLIYSKASKKSLSENQIKLLDDLNIIISSDFENVTELRNNINLIEKEAIEVLSEDEIYVILAATSVAKNTFEYWSENHKKWNELLSSNIKDGQKEEEEEDTFSWKTVGEIDVAVGGGMASKTGIKLLLSGGPKGWKAWVAIVGGSAAAGSTTAAIYQYFEDN